MTKRFWFALFGATLALAALGTAAGASTGGGNSDAAHACQQGGYKSLVGTNGGFTTVGECVSYAAHGGTFVTPGAGEFLLPAGQTATLSGSQLSACNDLTYGYQLSGGSFTAVANKPYGCSTVSEPGTTIGPFPTAMIFRVVLVDNSCGQTFDSTGGHALVTGSNPADVQITDAGFYCEAGPTRPPAPTGNLSTLVTIA
jgi:hypothetical protein